MLHLSIRRIRRLADADVEAGRLLILLLSWITIDIALLVNLYFLWLLLLIMCQRLILIQISFWKVRDVRPWFLDLAGHPDRLIVFLFRVGTDTLALPRLRHSILSGSSGPLSTLCSRGAVSGMLAVSLQLNIRILFGNHPCNIWLPMWEKYARIRHIIWLI